MHSVVVMKLFERNIKRGREENLGLRPELCDDLKQIQGLPPPLLTNNQTYILVVISKCLFIFEFVRKN